MDAIEIRHVTKRYAAGRIANDDICLAVAQGEIFCLLGPNGAGKSTLVKQITTHLRSTAGCILVNGIDVRRAPRVARTLMGVMPQECGLPEHLTLGQIMSVFSHIKNKSAGAASRDMADTLQRLDIKSLAAHRLSEMSLGQKRATLLALALLGDPEIFILDEPTTGLDPAARRRVWQVLSEEKAKSKTIFLTTHLMEEAEQHVDRIGIIRSGILQFQGRIPELRAAQAGWFELRYRVNDHASSIKCEDIASALRYAQAHALTDFALAPASLENLYFDILKKAGDPCLAS